MAEEPKGSEEVKGMFEDQQNKQKLVIGKHRLLLTLARTISKVKKR